MWTQILTWKEEDAMPRMHRPPEPPIYTFRVRILGGFSVLAEAWPVWREIEVTANQTLVDLGEAIPLACGTAPICVHGSITPQTPLPCNSWHCADATAAT
jgi:hypothetical protein